MAILRNRKKARQISISIIMKMILKYNFRSIPI
jgi:hypothetical protein